MDFLLAHPGPLYLDQIDGLQHGLWHILSWLLNAWRGHANNVMEDQWKVAQTHTTTRESPQYASVFPYFAVQSVPKISWWLQHIPNHLCPTFGLQFHVKQNHYVFLT